MQYRPRPGATPLCPVLIGREDLLALAERRIGTVGGGTGHLLFLAGEAGMGKTRLLAAIRERAAGQDFEFVTVGAYPRDMEVAGGLLADLAATLRRLPATADAGAQMAERLRAGVGTSGDAYRHRRLMVADLAETIVSLGGPMLLALEDLHWADDLTLEVLDRAARRLATTPMLVVGTYRTDELYPKVPMRAWRTRWLVSRVAEEARLTRLDRDETAAMTAAIADDVLPAALTAAVFERSDGIPLHIEEFLAILAQPDALLGRVPDTLADAVLARAEALSPEARRLAGAASVIGRSFDIDLLTAITNDTPEGIDTALRELDERFFVQPRDDGPAYDFRHALIRDALYDDLPPHRRRDLHARTAAAASAAGFGDAFVSDHYERAHQPAPAYRHALAAAAGATAISAHQQAVELYRRAQRTVPADTPGPERADLLGALAAELAATDDNTAAAATYREAYELRRGLGDDAGAAALVPAWVAVRHLLGDDLGERTGRLGEALALIGPVDDQSTQDIRARILAGLSAAYMLDRRLDESIEYGQQARTLAGDVGNLAARLNTDATLGAVLVFAGRMEEGWGLLETAIAEGRAAQLEAETARGYRMLGSCASVLVEYDRGRQRLREGIAYAERTERFNDRHYMAAQLAHVHWATGDWASAEREAKQALADGRGGVTTRNVALYVLGYLALGRGDWRSADEQLREARRLGEQMHELQRLSPAVWGLAEAALHSGNVSGAVELCEHGYAASFAVHDAAYLFPFLVTGLRAYLASDDLMGARDWFEKVERLLRQRGIPGTLPSVHHAQGLLHLAAGHTGRAREALVAASAGWAARGRFWEGTQALLDQAEAAQRSRRPAESLALAAEARRRADAVGAATLCSLAGPAPTLRPVHDDAPLTARETEVARLVATGATNRQIATALAISPKTVAAHVEHILTKLGAARRTEIAAWATAHGPSPRSSSPQA